MSKDKLTRRAFLAAATTTATMAITGCATRVNRARVIPRKFSPNERLSLAGIGVGGKGRADVSNSSQHNVDVVALCDPDAGRAAQMFAAFPNARRFKDYREMLEKMPEIDVVTISTPDHTHAPPAYMAMKLGKHVYVQKPLTHTVAEARLLKETAREMGVVTQMGNQGHSTDGTRELYEMIQTGAIGNVREAHTWTNRPIWPQGIPNPLPPEPVPETLDWDLWIGPAPMRPYNSGYAPFNWRGWWDFGCGALGDMACHLMDPPFWALDLGKARTFTVEVLQQDGENKQTAPNSSIIKYSFPRRGGWGPVDLYWYDGGNLPSRPAGLAETEVIGDRRDKMRGSLFIGAKGILTAGAHGAEPRLLPESRMADYSPPEPWLDRVPKQNHYADWLNAVRNGRQACSNFDYAGPFTEMVLLGNIALRTGVKLEWDARRFKIANHEPANALIGKQYRKGWELPVRGA